MSKNIHISKNNFGGWKAQQEKTNSPLSNFQTQKEAINFGTRVAKNYKSEIIIHGRDGKIREKNTFGNDPFPPNG